MLRYSKFQLTELDSSEGGRPELDFNDLPLSIAQELVSVLQSYKQFNSIRRLIAELEAETPLSV